MAATLTKRRRSKTNTTHAWTAWMESRGLPAIPGYCPIASQAPGDWFDPAAADKVIEFFTDYLHHVKGPMARQPYIPMPFEQVVFGCALGWKREDGKRRYRKVFEYIPKKNSKSTRAAGLTLYFTGCDGEYGAEVYSIAKTKEQATIIFRTAMEMRKLSRKLQDHFTVFGASGGSQQKSIFCDSMGGSFYRPLAYDDDAADGLNIHAAIIDELHRHDSGAMLDIIERNTSAREQPMIWIITTADYARESICNRELMMAKLIRDNGGDISKPGFAPHVLPVIYEAEKSDDYTDERVWYRVNPGLGKSKSIEHMRQECEKAKLDGIARNNFLRFELNVQTEQLDALFDMQHWAACPSEFDIKDLAGRMCYGGLDLGERDDLAAFVLCFPPDDKRTGIYHMLFYSYCCDETIRRRRAEAIPYDVWCESGHLIKTPGNDVDFDWIERDIVAASQRFRIVSVGYDPRLATQISQNLFNKHGISVEPIRQGHESLSEPTAELKSIINTHRLNHGGNPVAEWNAKNAIGEKNLSGHERPVKGKSKDKIDLIVAAIMALKGVMMTPEVGQPQVIMV